MCDPASGNAQIFYHHISESTQGWPCNPPTNNTQHGMYGQTTEDRTAAHKIAKPSCASKNRRDKAPQSRTLAQLHHVAQRTGGNINPRGFEQRQIGPHHPVSIEDFTKSDHVKTVISETVSRPSIVLVTRQPKFWAQGFLRDCVIDMRAALGLVRYSSR